jgi:WD40 repeat protein
LATLSREDHAIDIWGLQSLAKITTLRGHSDDVVQVQFSPDSRLLATGSVDRTVKVWNTIDWSLFRSLDQHQNVISAIAFSPNSKQIAVGTTVGTLNIWDLEAGTSIVSRIQYDTWYSAAFSILH